MRTRTLPAALLTFALVTVARADDAATTAPATEAKSYGSGGQPTLRLNVPAAWADVSKKPPAGARVAPVLQFSAKDADKPFAVSLTYTVTPKTKTMSDPELRRTALFASKKYAAESTEKRAELVPLTGEQLAGYSATFHSTSEPPGEFAVVTTVTAKLGDGLITATIQHANDSANQPLALEMLRTATLGPPAAAASPARHTHAK